jgi:molybdate/tungstate transport system substrate-binding protein
MNKPLVVVLAAGAVLLAACGGSTTATTGSSSTSASASAAPKASGTVQVLYAASLENLMEKDLGGAYKSASGVTFQGTPAGSTELVSDIKGKVKPADVFISASTDANTGLMGASNGDWEDWYATFATAPLVLGYNPNSKFAADLKSKPWQQVVTEPGFLLGTTDPKLDPKGKLAATALSTEKIDAGKAQVFPEEQLVGRLSAGQLDAGFFYSSEAADAKIPTVPLTGLTLKATYTVSVLNNAPNQAAGVSFVDYLLSSAGKQLLTKHGLSLQTVKVTGDSTKVPAALDSETGVK